MAVLQQLTCHLMPDHCKFTHRIFALGNPHMSTSLGIVSPDDVHLHYPYKVLLPTRSENVSSGTPVLYSH